MARVLLSFALTLSATVALQGLVSLVWVFSAGPSIAGGERAVLGLLASVGALALLGPAVYGALVWGAAAHWAARLGLGVLQLLLGAGAAVACGFFGVVLLNR